MNRWQAFRFVQVLVANRLAAEDSLQEWIVCRIFSRPIFQALGTEDIRHRRVASAEILLRRLLVLDYVLEHPGLALAADRDGEGPCLRLEQQARKHRYKTMIEGFASWGSTRIAIGGF